MFRTERALVGEQLQCMSNREPTGCLGLVTDGPQRRIMMGSHVEGQVHLHLIAAVGVEWKQLFEDMDGTAASVQVRSCVAK